MKFSIKFLAILFFLTSIIFAQENYRLFINNIDIPFDNKGILADVTIPFVWNGARFDSIVFLYSGGFLLTGINGDSIWSNGVATSNLVNDYQPGKVGSLPGDPQNKIYVINSSDSAFGTSWQDYRNAVNSGADFYDGNNDGVYDPVDLNGNNSWDMNEDRPDILGDVTAWCVYNDGVPVNQRYFYQNPLGLEIQQTIFAYSQNTAPFLTNTIYIRYRILNTGTEFSSLDSVYFSSWSDPDIGDPSDDNFGTDSLLNSGFSYNKNFDLLYGINPPAFYSTILQGPFSFIPGVTFVDLNSNGIFDEGFDTPLDSAINNRGPELGKDFVPGARNQDLNSSMLNINADPFLGHAHNKTEARNYILGKLKNGNVINPCNFTYGHVLNSNCNDVNPYKIFSGDPLTNTGWLSKNGYNIFTLTSTGPFNLTTNKPVDIIIAYNVGRGIDNWNSIDKGRAVTKTSINFYNSNFTDFSVDTKHDVSLHLNNFELLQNYPNPFNPTTNIRFRIANLRFVSLKVYDVLGREIETLVAEEKPAGIYEVKFDASSLSSGIYFYVLKTENFYSPKKMILLK